MRKSHTKTTQLIRQYLPKILCTVSLNLDIDNELVLPVGLGEVILLVVVLLIIRLILKKKL